MLNDRASRILSECAELLQRKSQDYSGGSRVDELDYYKFEQDNPNLQILHTKVLRYASLTSQSGNQNFESIEDTLMDIVNYAALAIAVLETNKENNND